MSVDLLNVLFANKDGKAFFEDGREVDPQWKIDPKTGQPVPPVIEKFYSPYHHGEVAYAEPAAEVLAAFGRSEKYFATKESYPVVVLPQTHDGYMEGYTLNGLVVEKNSRQWAVLQLLGTLQLMSETDTIFGSAAQVAAMLEQPPYEKFGKETTASRINTPAFGVAIIRALSNPGNLAVIRWPGGQTPENPALNPFADLQRRAETVKQLAAPHKGDLENPAHSVYDWIKQDTLTKLSRFLANIQFYLAKVENGQKDRQNFALLKENVEKAEAAISQLGWDKKGWQSPLEAAQNHTLTQQELEQLWQQHVSRNTTPLQGSDDRAVKLYLRRGKSQYEMEAVYQIMGLNTPTPFIGIKAAHYISKVREAGKYDFFVSMLRGIKPQLEETGQPIPGREIRQDIEEVGPKSLLPVESLLTDSEILAEKDQLPTMVGEWVTLDMTTFYRVVIGDVIVISENQTRENWMIAQTVIAFKKVILMGEAPIVNLYLENQAQIKCIGDVDLARVNIVRMSLSELVELAEKKGGNQWEKAISKSK